MLRLRGRVHVALQPFCYSFARISASDVRPLLDRTSQRVMEEQCQGKQRDFLPS